MICSTFEDLNSLPFFCLYLCFSLLFSIVTFLFVSLCLSLSLTHHVCLLFTPLVSVGLLVSSSQPPRIRTRLWGRTVWRACVRSLRCTSWRLCQESIFTHTHTHTHTVSRLSLLSLHSLLLDYLTIVEFLVFRVLKGLSHAHTNVFVVGVPLSFVHWSVGSKVMQAKEIDRVL